MVSTLVQLAASRNYKGVQQDDLHLAKAYDMFANVFVPTISRYDDEEYGECQNCEKAITPKRLEAIPWARYCLECQELVEQGLLDEEE